MARNPERSATFGQLVDVCEDASDIPGIVMLVAMKVVNQLESFGVRILTDRDPDFAVELAKIAMPDAIARMTSILPYSVIVRNDSGRPLPGAIVRWDYMDLHTGEPRSRTYTVYTINRIPEQMVDNGLSIFVSSVGGLTMALTRSNRPKDLPPFLPAWEEDIQRQVEEFSQQQQPVTVRFDALILENGTFVGPDQGRAMDRLNGMLDAERDLYKEVAKLNPDQVRDYLDRVAGTPFPPATSAETRDFYVEQMVLQARSMLGALARGRVAERDMVAQCKSGPPADRYTRFVRAPSP